MKYFIGAAVILAIAFEIFCLVIGIKKDGDDDGTS